MKRFILTMVTVLTLGAAANAMSYKSARDQAFFLTDKMAYELALSDDQYNAVFEINMDYIMCLDVYDDIFGTFWNRRNNELRFVLSPAQYQMYLTLEHFYRPVSWVNNKFVFTIYNRYPKGRYYRAAPPGRCTRALTATLTTVLTMDAPLVLPKVSHSPSPAWAAARASLAARASPA